MTDDLGAHDIEELRALMRLHHLLPDVPATLVAPAVPTSVGTAVPGGRTDRGSDASEALLAGILATPRPAAASTGTGTSTEASEAGASQPAHRRPGAARPRRRVHRRATALAVAAATVVVAVVGSQLSSTPTAVAGGAPSLTYTEGTPEAAWDGSLPSARDTLLELATVADEAPDLPRTGDVQRVSLYAWLGEVDGGTRTTTVYPTADERWVGSDGAVRVVQRRAEAVRYDGRVDTTASESAAGPLSSDDFFPGTVDPFAVAGLPTDTDGMESALLDHMPQEFAEAPEYRDTVLVESAVDLSRTSIVPQDVASAMLTVLSDAPTIQLLGDTTDRLGRPGVAVALPDSLSKDSGIEAVTVLIISPTDGQLLGTEVVTLDDPTIDVDEPTVTGFTTITDRRWVAAIGD